MLQLTLPGKEEKAMAEKQDVLLTPEKMRDIREKVYPYSEAIPFTDSEELVEKVQIETAKAQLAEILKHRLDRPKLREKIKAILKRFEGTAFYPYSSSVVEALTGELEALIPDEPQWDARIGEARREGAKQEKERIRARLWGTILKPDANPQLRSLIEEALKGG